MTAAATYPVGSVNPSRRGTTDWSIKLPVASGVRSTAPLLPLLPHSAAAPPPYEIRKKERWRGERVCSSGGGGKRRRRREE